MDTVYRQYGARPHRNPLVPGDNFKALFKPPEVAAGTMGGTLSTTGATRKGRFRVREDT